MPGIRNWSKTCLKPWTADQMPPHPELHYELRGNPSNPLVVFLHGFMGSSKDWHEIMDLLADSCLCLAIDLPGHGKSTGLTDQGAYTFAGAASHVVGVIKKTNAAPATVMGYSMGGRIALSVAMQYRHGCGKLVIESATAGIVDEKERAKRKALDQDRALELGRGKFEEFLRTWYCQPIFQTLAESPERLETVIRQRLFNDPLELSQALGGMGVGVQPSLWDRLTGWPHQRCCLLAKRTASTLISFNPWPRCYQKGVWPSFRERAIMSTWKIPSKWRTMFGTLY